jgi:uncharacterized damage-inducible protein DinB
MIPFRIGALAPKEKLARPCVHTLLEVLMKIQVVQFLYDYNYWANQRILTTAERLTEEQFLAPRSYSHGSVRNTLVHILNAEWIWRVRCQEHLSPTAMPLFDDFPSLETLRRRWQGEEQRMRGYLQGLSDSELDRIVKYKRTGGQPQENILWHLLVHVVNHGTEHRSTVAAWLTEEGHSPGDLDIVHFTRV